MSAQPKPIYEPEITRPRHVFCAVEHEHRNLLVAQDVCAGRFTQIGITFELGTKPDWFTPVIDGDREWRIEWSKFYYGLDLAWAFTETEEQKFLVAWEDLVGSWIRQVPPDYDVSDVIGRRIQNWIYAWQEFVAAPHFVAFRPGFEQSLVTSLEQQIQHLRHHLSAERNHRTLELYALFIASLALPGIGSADLLQFAMEELHKNLLCDLRADGVHREHSTHYHMLVLRSFVAARENARRFGLKFSGSYDSTLEKACEFAVHCHRPDGQIPALSDSDTGNYSSVLRLAATLLNRPDFLYAATGGMEGLPPSRRFVSFPEAGYYVQRSGWGDRQTPFNQERYLIFDCGALGDGGHGHYDLLNIEVSAGGLPLIVDPGRYTYAEQTPNLRHWFKGTAAHNTVCIDGLDQVPYRPGKPKCPLPEARFIERCSAPRLDMLCGVARSPSYEVVHTRRIFFIAGEYWIIHDRLRGDTPHRFDLRFHLSDGAWENTVVTLGGRQASVLAPGVALLFNSAAVPTIEPGWVAPKYGTKRPAPVVSVAVENRESVDFITAVVPLESHEAAPEFRVCFDRGDGSDAISAQLSGVGQSRAATDHLIWSSSITAHEAGPFHCRASSVWWRTFGDENLSELIACNVQELRWKETGKREYLHSGNPSEWLSWEHGLAARCGGRE